MARGATPSTGLNHLDEQRRCVVAPAGLHGGLDDLLRRGVGGAEVFVENFIAETVDHTIRAEEKTIARLEDDRADLGRDELIPGTERLLQDVPPRVVARLALDDLPVSQHPADVRVVLGDLPQASCAGGQVVNP